MVTTITFITHANPPESIDDHWQGEKTDPSLTEQGIESATRLAHTLKPIHFDAAFTDHLQRTTQTVKIITQDRPLVHLFVNEDLTDRSIVALTRDSAVDATPHTDESIRKDKRIKQIESDEHVLARTLKFIDEISKGTYKDKHVLATSHTDNVRLLYTHLKTVDKPTDFKVHECAMLTIEIRDDLVKPVIMQEEGIAQRS